MNDKPQSNNGRPPRVDTTGYFSAFMGRIVEMTESGLWDWDLRTGRVVYSPQRERLAGYSPGELPQDIFAWENAVLPADLPGTNAIIGMTTIARKTDDPEKMQYCLGRISTASGQLLELINDILDISKIESGKLELAPHVLDFEKMMQKLLSVIEVRAEEKHQSFTFDSEDVRVCFKNILGSFSLECDLAAGMNDHVTKPIDVDTLMATLAHYLGGDRHDA